MQSARGAKSRWEAKETLSRFLTAFLAAILVLWVVCASPAAPPVIEAKEVSTPPILDGNLDDPCWQSLPEITGFVDPRTRQLCAHQSAVKLCYDQRNIYVAFHAMHPDPAKIRAFEKKRNSGRIFRDDAVFIGIDSTHQHRANSGFRVNAIGTQYEELEGGSSTNLTWRGDWRAAARRVPDGYNVEMAIPFSLLRFNKNQDTFGIVLGRNVPEDDVNVQWPDLEGAWEIDRNADWKGLKLPWVRPRPVVLAYATGGSGLDDTKQARGGFDVKYPFANDSLGLLSIKPDFSSIEQDVETIDFSYTERQLSDRRPFFQEWNLGTSTALFYSRRVPDFDAGTRVVVRSGPNVYGIMNATTPGLRSDSLIRYQTNIGERSNFRFGYTDHWVPGHRNTVSYFASSYGWRTGTRHHEFGGSIYTSDTTGGSRGSLRHVRYNSAAGYNDLQFWWDIGQADADYNPELGYYPDRDIRGGYVQVRKPWAFPGRNLSSTSVTCYVERNDHFDGSPFTRDFAVAADADFVDGHGFSADFSRSRRELYHDSTQSLSAHWNAHIPDMDGGVAYRWGRTAGGKMVYYSVYQALKLTRDLAVSASFEQNRISAPSAYAGRQGLLIGTINYDLTSEKSIGARFVRREGGSNIYGILRQQVRRGLDAFLIYGDPNADTTQGGLTFKVVYPM